MKTCLLPILSSKESLAHSCVSLLAFPTEKWNFPLIFFVLIVWYDSLVLCVCVGIRSNMALCSSTITDIVFVPVGAYPPCYEHQFFSLKAQIGTLQASDVFIDVLIDCLSARGRLRAGAGEQRKPERSQRFSKGAGCGWKDALSLDRRGFPTEMFWWPSCERDAGVSKKSPYSCLDICSCVKKTAKQKKAQLSI